MISAAKKSSFMEFFIFLHLLTTQTYGSTGNHNVEKGFISYAIVSCGHTGLFMCFIIQNDYKHIPTSSNFDEWRP
jgi:hypothetical protein